MGTEELWEMINRAEDNDIPVDIVFMHDYNEIIVEAQIGDEWIENEDLEEELERFADNNDYLEANAYYYG